MNRKTLTALAAFAILGLVAFFVMRQPEKGERAGDHARPMAKLDPQAFDRIDVTRDGVTSTLMREAGKFKVTAPVAAAADDAAVKAAFEALEQLDFGNIVSQDKAKQTEFEVDGPKAIHVVAKSEKTGAVVGDLLVGRAAGNGTMARVAGKDDTWQVTGPLRSTFDKSAADWRDRNVATFSSADAETITVKAKDGGVVVLKRAGKAPSGEDKWAVVSAVPKFDRVDDSVANGLVGSLSAFKTNDFATGMTPAQTGLDAPDLTVTVGLKGGKNVTVLAGNKKGKDELYMMSASTPQIYVVKSFNYGPIVKRPLDFKDKTIADVGEADLKEVAVTRGADSYTLVHEGTTWKAAKPPKFALDPGRTPAIGGAFKDWKATKIAENVTPASTGLAKPKATIAMKTMKGDTTTFKVGDEDPQDKASVYLSSSKSPDIYVVSKWSTDRLLVKLDDLKKK
jgi:hypothetical protein